jgi:hypothetical protein
VPLELTVFQAAWSVQAGQGFDIEPAESKIAGRAFRVSATSAWLLDCLHERVLGLSEWAHLIGLMLRAAAPAYR